jgi:hypothetical protein
MQLKLYWVTVRLCFCNLLEEVVLDIYILLTFHAFATEATYYEWHGSSKDRQGRCESVR